MSNLGRAPAKLCPMHTTPTLSSASQIAWQTHGFDRAMGFVRRCCRAVLCPPPVTAAKYTGSATLLVSCGARANSIVQSNPPVCAAPQSLSLAKQRRIGIVLRSSAAHMRVPTGCTATPNHLHSERLRTRTVRNSGTCEGRALQAGQRHSAANVVHGASILPVRSEYFRYLANIFKNSNKKIIVPLTLL
jgi:hypothetical protein